MTSFTRWVTWNLFLALIPVVLAYALAWGLSGKGKNRRLPIWVNVPLAIAWLAFLPNSCYLLSEWRHLLLDRRWSVFLDAAEENDPFAMLTIAKWSIFFLLYSGAGMLLFVLAVRPIERWLASVGKPMFIVAPFLFTLASLGVYLGLHKRLNSWYLVDRPGLVLSDIVNALTNSTKLAAILVFAAVLWCLYEAVDIWVDGIADRLRRWGVLRSGARSRALS